MSDEKRILSPKEKRFWEIASYLVSPEYRPVDWRDKVARAFLELPEDSRQDPRLDKYIRGLMDLYSYVDVSLQSKEAPALPALTLEVSRRFGPYAFIFSVINNTDGYNVALDIKCHILGKDSEKNICEKFRWTRKQLEIFKRCFFDVDEHLNNPSYILHYAIFFKSQKYNFADPEIRALFTCYFNGLDAFYFTRQRSGLMQYTYTKHTVEPTDLDVQANFIKWKTHMILESLESPEEFAAFLKAVKDYFKGDAEGRNKETDYLMMSLYDTLKFELKGKSNVKALESADIIDIDLKKEVFDEHVEL